MKELVNRVANSSLHTINLELLFPEHDIQVFDIKEYLFMELILKEKDFRLALKEHDWMQYENKVLCVYCSADAIIPVWAYMLVAGYASHSAHAVYQGEPNQYIQQAMIQSINDLDLTPYQEGRVVVKGCSAKPVPEAAYLHLTSRLQPIVQSVMYGEACSTVPIFKRPRKLVTKD